MNGCGAAEPKDKRSEKPTLLDWQGGRSGEWDVFKAGTQLFGCMEASTALGEVLILELDEQGDPIRRADGWIDHRGQGWGATVEGYGVLQVKGAIEFRKHVEGTPSSWYRPAGWGEVIADGQHVGLGLKEVRDGFAVGLKAEFRHLSGEMLMQELERAAREYAIKMNPPSSARILRFHWSEPALLARIERSEP